ncbi:hypothetical protein EB796_020207 [Bugula neritina]|uniref:Uncharacterized protein n=1 Tax=Bugula neritina TaxID=10212 RepID=A0A7J7J6W3_BUGNE|nr:hypothetical protein EB796_020207 [Bugula neritina]
MVALVGRSLSGKTSLIYAISFDEIFYPMIYTSNYPLSHSTMEIFSWVVNERKHLCGSMVALVGRSLSGKTSLIYTIMNFDEPL